MKHFLLALFVSIGLLGCAKDERFGADAQCLEVNPVIGRVYNARMFDVNNDGISEEVVIYTSDGDVFLEVFENPDTLPCTTIFDVKLDTLKLIDRRMTLSVIEVELIDVTGDDIPELHIGFEKQGGGRYASGTVHHLYETKNWERIFISNTCLRSNVFEIRDVAASAMKEIYYENDIICDEVTGTRNYACFRWDGTQFQMLEQGERNPALWEDPFSFGLLLNYLFYCVVFPFGLFIWVSVIRNRERPVIQ